MAEKPKNKILGIVGPTASGKSALALELADRLSGEIVSCDSMQVYRRMDIGTAKPTAEELRRVAHHMIDIVEPYEEFTAADYVERADEAVKDILERGRLPVFCGGTGLYLDSFLRGGFEETRGDSRIRENLLKDAERLGPQEMHKKLAEIDPESALAIHPNNVRRVIRALEIFYLTGKTKTELDKMTQSYPERYDAVIIGLRFENREILYRRIDERVDKMIAAGLLGETSSLLSEGVFEKSRTAAQAIGYKELLGYIRGEVTLGEAVSDLKKATRHYAKRQMTWFCANPRVEWIYVDRLRPGELVHTALQIWDKHNKTGI